MGGNSMTNYYKEKEGISNWIYKLQSQMVEGEIKNTYENKDKIYHLLKARLNLVNKKHKRN